MDLDVIVAIGNLDILYSGNEGLIKYKMINNKVNDKRIEGSLVFDELMNLTVINMSFIEKERERALIKHSPIYSLVEKILSERYKLEFNSPK